ncbi:RNA-binding protein 41-like [Dermacentor silvarum]|uniref:RNA-binding protein 41-like n=1 Tax=Dermacentor silvarum TaxID=543639 RepID=UPI00189743BA|nr:RNA-binding protein 41-like [Dermacentor silvarum]
MNYDNLRSPYEDELPGKCPRKRLRGEHGAETESEKLLQEMLTKQLDTRFSVKHLSEQQKHFTAAGNYVELPVAGARSLDEYKAVGSREQEIQVLLQCGLTNDEIELYLQSKESAMVKQKHPLMNPTLLDSRLKQIELKVKNGKKCIEDACLNHLRSDEQLGYLKMNTDDTLLSKDITCAKSGSSQTTVPKDPMSHIADFSQRLMERVMSKRKKKRQTKPDESPSHINENEKQALDTSSECTQEQPGPDPTVYHAVVPLPEHEIAAERLGLEEIRKLPRFQNYSPGSENQVLYLKNLHYKVDIRELMALFCRFDEETCLVKYRLLSGKLRGQAFVTLPSVQAATKALELCNGYVLRGKPVIIEYGKNQP